MAESAKKDKSSDKALQEMKKANRVLYFAYGSNMLSEHLDSRLTSLNIVGPPSLQDKKMLFNKRSKDGSGKANIISSPGSVTWGVLYEINTQDLKTLDKIEGGYERVTVRVRRPDGNEFEAITYVSEDLTNDPRPYRWYKELVLLGALEHDLPRDYVAYVEGFPVKPADVIEISC
jgi:gamma-glutamylcyclotransferase (GGCT)/AIG2-like uncharacterized protein YtfP